jgi:hypothetical protein
MAAPDKFNELAFLVLSNLGSNPFKRERNPRYGCWNAAFRVLCKTGCLFNLSGRTVMELTSSSYRLTCPGVKSDAGIVGRNILFRNISIRLVVAAIAMGCGSAGAQTAGDWVLGNYRNAGYWFPGIAEKVQDGKVTIRYDDGDRETVQLKNVRPYNWAIGMKVECNYKNAGEWYPGTIASLGGDRIGINYDDGDKEKTRTGRCRSR